jgi:TPR repeat protein
MFKPKFLFKTKTLEFDEVDPKFRESLLSMPGSGSHAHVSEQLLEPLKTARRDLKARAASAMTSLPANSGVAKGLGIQLFKRAQRMRADSFQERDVAKCARMNQDAEQLLNNAMGLGNLPARAALAEMYLSRDKVGVKPPIMEHMPMAVDLVSEVANEDTDCMGVLAYCHFKYNMVNEAAPLAAQSAALGSKYGQFVSGLIQRNQRNYAGAHRWFSLAAGQNFDEAQIGLAELYSSGHIMGGTKEEDKKEARRLLELASEQGNDKAILYIGFSYGDDAAEMKSQELFDEACKWIGYAIEAETDNAHNALRVVINQFEASPPPRKKNK